ncbi:MAG: hypothetical protein OEW19_15605 [Acidobacteriota bacterium]|nr:hypothetical protein [Acidobacteriota bacterium]
MPLLLGAAVLLLGAGLQAVNTALVASKLRNAAPNVVKVEGVGPASVWLAVTVPAMGAGTVGALQPVAHTSLLRTTCAGAWTLAFGARIDAFDSPRTISGVSLAGWQPCIDAGRAQQAAIVRDATISYLGCSAKLDSLQASLDGDTHAEVAARLELGASPACANLLPPSAGAVPMALLTPATLSLTARYDLPQTTTPAAAPSGGWLRRLLEMKTAHNLEVTLPAGRATVAFESTSASGSGASSPELHLTFHAEGLASSQLPADRRHIDLRWHLDHETGQAVLNGRTINRNPVAASRPAGLVTLGSEECGPTRPDDSRALHFVEAGEQGEPLRPEQLQRALAAVDDAVAGGGALVSVFVHGWQHSAASPDAYVCAFGDVVASAAEMERYAARTSGRRARQVIGIYVGWPGAVYPDELVNAVGTFWNRLGVADRLGARDAAVRMLIDGLSARVARGSREARADRRSVLVVAGHSMGARSVFHALQDTLLDTAAPAAGTPSPDLVLLLNPAFSATLYRALHDRQLKCAPERMPVLLFSSETDSVTRQVYPAGQTVTYPYGTGSAIPFLEYVYTAPNFQEFVTHRLRMELVKGDPPTPTGAQTILRGFERIPAGSQELYTDNPVTVYRQPASGRPGTDDAWYRMRLSAVEGHRECVPAGVSSAVVEVDTRIVPDHGSIFTPPFVEYIVRLLNRQARGPVAR